MRNPLVLYAAFQLPHSRQPRGLSAKEQDVPVEKSTEGEGQMAAYARIYGFQVVDGKTIKGREEEFTSLGGNCYLPNGEYEMLEEILEKEN